MAQFPRLQVQPHVLLSLVLYKLVNPVQARRLHHPPLQLPYANSDGQGLPSKLSTFSNENIVLRNEAF